MMKVVQVDCLIYLFGSFRRVFASGRRNHLCDDFCGLVVGKLHFFPRRRAISLHVRG